MTCPLCGSDRARPLPGPLVRCEGCGLVRTEPAPVASVSYDQDYFTERNAYEARAEEFSAYFRALMDDIARVRATGRLLDIGCGPGLLLEEARNRGYAAAGCDVSAWAVEAARRRGFDARTGVLQALQYPEGAFDIVVANHTLEHIPEPLPFLREARRLLAPGGLLAIGVPNHASLMSTVMGARWHSLLPDQHYWHFTPATLTRMLREAGFAPNVMNTGGGRHVHPNAAKALALNLVVAIANRVGRGEALIALATLAG